MHEYSITSSIVDILERIIKEKKLSRVYRIDFEVSKLSSIEPQSIEFYFRFLTLENESLKNARLRFFDAKHEIKCKNCSKVFSVISFPLKCPSCYGYNAVEGKIEDIKIKRIRAG